MQLRSANDDVFAGGVLEIFYHGFDTGRMRRGYHCPSCGQFYVEGEYTLENETHIVAREMMAVCCGVFLPTPAVFTKSELQRCLQPLLGNKVTLRSRLIKKEGLNFSYYNPSAIEYFIAHPDTTLRVVQ